MIMFNRTRPIQRIEALIGHVFLIDEEPYIVASTTFNKVMLISFSGTRWGDELYDIDTDCETILLAIKEEGIADTIEYIGRCNITIEPER